VTPAAAERVWDLLTDVEGWPLWYRACRWVRVVDQADCLYSEIGNCCPAGVIGHRRLLGLPASSQYPGRSSYGPLAFFFY